MNELIERLIASNFADLEGLQITGSVPVKQELLNEALAAVLKEGVPAPGKAGGESAEKPSATPKPDVNALLKLVTRAEITAHEGEIRLDFEIKR